MPKLPTAKPRVVIQFLERNGFVLDHVSGSHFIFYHPVSRRRAVVPRHNRDMPKGTLLALLREVGFARQELVGFLEGE
jgi:predicted RNA binding protein YcfA (HicA-like mRNA interferase family)